METKFTSIESFRHAIAKVRRYHDQRQKPYPTLKYQGTVKLHGTNAGIHRKPNGKIIPQGRNRILSVGSDNYGFAFFVESHIGAIQDLFNKYFEPEDDVTLYGEWCGEGVQKGVALVECPKHFVIFSAKVNGEYIHNRAEWRDNEHKIYNVLQIPQYTIEIDFMDPAPASEILSKLTMKVEEQCPWAKNMFDVEGVGEGIVWVPVDYPSISDLWFKTKGVKHKGNDKTKTKKIQIAPERLKAISDVADQVLPDWRLEQGFDHLREEGLPVLPESTGPYLKWIANDILKEEKDVLVANDLEWKQIQGELMKRARQHFLRECENVNG